MQFHKVGHSDDANFLESLPPCDDGNYRTGMNFSITVLFTDGKQWYKGYCIVEIDEYWESGFDVKWYQGDWIIYNVTHWTHFPDLPQE